MRFLLSLVFLLICWPGRAADPYPRQDGIDVIHYRFQLSLNDSTNRIAGTASIRIRIKKKIQEFELDLANRNEAGEGMEVAAVRVHGRLVHFVHLHDRIRIPLASADSPSDNLSIEIDYAGIPQDGLIISQNRFGDRTFFGDNWPDRAHQWLPCIDHPSDKATCEFDITAPEQYAVVGNGLKKEVRLLGAHQKLTRWEETIPIATKVMVVGVARFAVEQSGIPDGISVESWVYPQNQTEGFSDYSVAAKVLAFFQKQIGPYPYEKLANVQSRTKYGGMENASCIFYSENSVNGRNEDEGLIAHEIAHQWFGNSVSENDWHDVWLSEGFATYGMHLYNEATYGHEKMVTEMVNDRIAVIAYDKVNTSPIVDTVVTDLMKLLNTHSYQKGGWVLHMLRREVGDQSFWKGLQLYYSRYRNGNALTADFRRVMEEVSGNDLKDFFGQWLRQGGHPVINGQWHYDEGTHTIQITLRQDQPGIPFKTPIDLGVRFESSPLQVNHLRLNNKAQEYAIPAQKKPLEVICDPDAWLLFEGKLESR